MPSHTALVSTADGCSDTQFTGDVRSSTGARPFPTIHDLLAESEQGPDDNIALVPITRAQPSSSSLNVKRSQLLSQLGEDANLRQQILTRCPHNGITDIISVISIVWPSDPEAENDGDQTTEMDINDLQQRVLGYMDHFYLNEPLSVAIGSSTQTKNPIGWRERIKDFRSLQTFREELTNIIIEGPMETHVNHVRNLYFDKTQQLSTKYGLNMVPSEFSSNETISFGDHQIKDRWDDMMRLPNCSETLRKAIREGLSRDDGGISDEIWKSYIERWDCAAIGNTKKKLTGQFSRETDPLQEANPLIKAIATSNGSDVLDDLFKYQNSLKSLSDDPDMKVTHDDLLDELRTKYKVPLDGGSDAKSSGFRRLMARMMIRSHRQERSDV
ncbi:hypothetical protein V866_000548 [Kwoniella sp. B9012]